MAEEFIAAVLLATGLCTRYNPGIMDQVVANRIRWHQLPEGTDPARCVALLDKCDIGKQVWVQAPDGRIVGPLIVADCAKAVHRPMLKLREWAVDLSWELAVELGVIDRPVRGFKVWDKDPRTAPHAGTDGRR